MQGLEAKARSRLSVAVVFYVVSVVVFILAGLGVDVGSLSELDLACFGLAAFALAHVV